MPTQVAPRLIAFCVRTIGTVQMLFPSPGTAELGAALPATVEQGGRPPGVPAARAQC